MTSVVDELYKQLNKVSDELTQELGRPVSMREALLYWIESRRLEPSDFFWSWRITRSSSTEIVHNKEPVQGPVLRTATNEDYAMS